VSELVNSDACPCPTTQEAFYPEIYTFANTNNFGGRFFYPGRFDNESLLAFE
jgi:hypothetical protein